MRKLFIPIFKAVFSNKPAQLPLDPKKIKKTLVIRYDVAGDMIVTTPIFELLKKVNPDMKVDLVASNRNKFIIEGSDFVDDIFIADRSFKSHLNLVPKLRAKNYDLILPVVFHKATNNGMIANLIGGKNSVKVTLSHGKRNKLYATLYNYLHQSDSADILMSGLLKDIIRSLFARPELDAPQRVVIPESSRNLASNLIRSLPREKSIVYNMSAGREENSWLAEQKVEFVNMIYKGWGSDYNIVLIAAPGDEDLSQDLVKKHPEKYHFFRPTKNYSDTAAIVANADILVTPDTSIAHLGAVFSLPTFVKYKLFDPNRPMWKPDTKQFGYACSKDGYIKNLKPQEAFEKLKLFYQSLR
ncbi:MAG: glycosyltransferase family 9 protein [Candidatus Kapaibacteriales bacterium]